VRPESYRVVDWNNIEILSECLDTKKSWRKKRDIVFARNKTYTDLTSLIELANHNKLSLAIYKPKRFIDLTIEPVEREWSPQKLSILDKMSKQLNLFQSPEETKKQFKFVDKLPYKFSYKFEDKCGKRRRLMIEDWEIGALYWHCLKRAKGNEEIALEKVRQKYWTTFTELDTHLFLGTTKAFHGRARNPFVIIGVFPAPKERQPSLLQYVEQPLPLMP